MTSRRARRAPIAILAVCAGALAAPASGYAAEAMFGVTTDNRIVTFQSDNPSNVVRSSEITGLGSGEQLLAIDVRPLTGQLYGLGSSNQIFRINARTGAATAVAADVLTPPLNGTAFGFDFNPTVDRIRVTSDNEQNLRLNPDSGGVAAEDGPLAYAAGDPGEGSNPNVRASAYTNSVAGATSTTLFDIDNARNTLVRQDPPNAGTLVTVGALGAGTGASAFDISAADNVGWAVLGLRAGSTDVGLYRIDLTTGRATPAATLPTIGTDSPLRGLATAGTVPDDKTRPEVSVALSSTQLESRLLDRGVAMSISCNEACIADARVTFAGRRAGQGGVAVQGGPGRETLRIPLNAATRAAIRRAGTIRLSVRITVTDGAGNSVAQTRVLRSQTLEQRLG